MLIVSLFFIIFFLCSHQVKSGSTGSAIQSQETSHRLWPGPMIIKSSFNVTNMLSSMASAQVMFGPAALAIAEVRNISNQIMAGRIPEETKAEMKNAREGLNGMSERVRVTIETLILEAKVRVEELRAKASCIRQRANEAREEAAHGLLEVGKCAIQSGQEAAASIGPIVKELEEHTKKLADVARKVTLGLIDCRKAENQQLCVKELLLAAEKAASPISNAIKACLMSARECWKQLVEYLRMCFIGGAETATVIEKELKLEILECVAYR